MLKRLPSAFLSTPNPRPQTSLVFRRVLHFRNIQPFYGPNPRPRTCSCCRCAPLRKSSWLLSMPKIKLRMIPTPRIVSFLHVFFVETSLYCRQVFSEWPVRVSTKSCQMSFDYLSGFLQFPVRTPPTSLQASSRKESDVNWEEVSTAHDWVNWTSSTGSLVEGSRSITSLTCSCLSP